MIIEFALIGCGLLYLYSMRLRRKHDAEMDAYAEELIANRKAHR